MKTYNIAAQLPVLKLVIPFIAGIFLVRLFPADETDIIWGLFFCAILLMILFVGRSSFKRNSVYYAVLLTPLLFVLGYIHIVDHENRKLISFSDQEKAYQLIIEDAKKLSVNYVRYTALAKVDSKYSHCGRVLLYGRSDTVLDPGSSIYGRFSFQRIKNRGNPGEFDYAGYCRNKHIQYSAWLNEYVVLGHERTLQYWNWRVKKKLLQIYSEARFDQENKALIFALTAGDKSIIEKEQLNAFSDAGIIHVLAVSGLHVGIVYLILLVFFKPLGGFRFGAVLSFVLCVISLFFYAFITGFSPSVVRAVVMFVFIDFAKLFKKQHLVYNIMAASALLIVMLDPHYAFQPGYWLSYGAVTSIILVMGLLKNYLNTQRWLIKKIMELFVVSIAAQPGTLPLVLHWFGRFPVYFLVANFLVVPFIGLILLYNFAIIGLGLVGVPLGFIARPLNSLLTYVNVVPRIISEFPHSILNTGKINLYMVFLLYLIFACILRMVYQKNLKWLKPILLLCIMAVFMNWNAYRTKIKSEELVLFNIGVEPVLIDRQGAQCVVYGDVNERSVHDYVLDEGLIIKGEKPRGRYVFAQGQLFDFGTTKNGANKNLPIKRYLIMDHYQESEMPQASFVKACIMLPKFSPYQKSSLNAWCTKNGIFCHDIETEGAFILTRSSSFMP